MLRRFFLSCVLGLLLCPCAVAQANFVPAVFNAEVGLSSWRQKLGAYKQLPRLRSFQELPRLNVVSIGHSLEEGVQDCPPGDLSEFAWRYTNLLRVQLREQVHGPLANSRTGPPPRGGTEFIASVDSHSTPMMAGTGNYFGGERYGAWTDHRYNDEIRAEGACLRYTQTTDPGARSRFYLWGPKFDSMFADLPKSVQMVYQQVPGGGAMEIAWTDWSESNVYASVTVSCDSPDGEKHFGVLSPPLAVTDPRGFWVRVRKVDTGSGAIRWEGTNFHSGDENWGIHVTNYACGGAISDTFKSDANMDALENADPHVVMIWLDYNDVVGARANGFQFWRDSIEETLQQIRNRMPNVSVLLKLGFDPVGGPWLIWQAMQSELESLAVEYDCAFFSHHIYARRASAEQFCVPFGIKEPGMAHFNRLQGQPFEADLMSRVLLGRYYQDPP